MKKYTRILVALTFLLALGVAANAENQAQIVVTLPFEFVASGKTLPAGTYSVKRISQQPFDTLLLTSYETGASVLVHPFAMENASANNPKVSFRKVGEQRLLSAIQTEDYVYGFPVSRSVILEAAAKQRDTVSVSVSGGSK
jgi:hypothetical protein